MLNFVDSKVENGFVHKKDVLATKQDISDLRIEIAESKVELLKWMLFIFMFVQTAVIVGLVKLLH